MSHDAQMNLFEAMREKDRGVAAAERGNANWIGIARGMARQICRERGTVTADDVREKLGEIRPAHPNAWGAVFRRGFTWTGEWRRSRVVAGHGNLQRVWRLAGG